MYHSANRYETICPEEGEPEWHDAEETIPLKCFYSCQYEDSFRNEHKEKSYSVDKEIMFFFLDIQCDAREHDIESS